MADRPAIPGTSTIRPAAPAAAAALRSPPAWCRWPMKEIDWGTHTVFIADVVDIELAEPGRPLIYAGRAYGVPRLQGEAAA